MPAVNVLKIRPVYIYGLISAITQLINSWVTDYPLGSYIGGAILGTLISLGLIWLWNKRPLKLTLMKWPGGGGGIVESNRPPSAEAQAKVDYWWDLGECMIKDDRLSLLVTHGFTREKALKAMGPVQEMRRLVSGTDEFETIWSREEESKGK